MTNLSNCNNNIFNNHNRHRITRCKGRHYTMVDMLELHPCPCKTDCLEAVEPTWLGKQKLNPLASKELRDQCMSTKK